MTKVSKTWSGSGLVKQVLVGLDQIQRRCRSDVRCLENNRSGISFFYQGGKLLTGVSKFWYPNFDQVDEFHWGVQILGQVCDHPGVKKCRKMSIFMVSKKLINFVGFSLFWVKPEKTPNFRSIFGSTRPWLDSTGPVKKMTCFSMFLTTRLSVSTA